MTLPVWEVENIGNKLGITCPRCKCKSLVARKWNKPKVRTTLSGKLTIIGRPCTYCSKTARLP